MSPEARRTRLLTSAVHSEARRALRGNGKQTGQSLRHDPDGSSPVSCPRDRKDRKEDRHRVSKAPLGRCCGASTWALYTARCRLSSFEQEWAGTQSLLSYSGI
uniref:Uncharacterized protein n=1 Tax=Plectus sambesii TaxID=2011161 RepID=A0A914VKK6_9BILA